MSAIMAEKLPSVMIERPKMPRATWDSLRAHIVKERQRKKLELERNAEYERQKKLEREHKKKQEALTLEETKEQIAQLELRVSNYKREKHELFNTLKKVLHEDDQRKKLKEAPYPHHPTLYMQSNVRTPGGIYMKPNTQLLITSQPAQPQAVKRQRSPSPQRSGIPANYYRSLPGGPSVSKYPTTTAYSAPTTAHYSTYPGAAVVSIASQLSHDQEVARAAKHIYLPPAAENPSQRSVYSDRASLHARSLAPPPAAHSSVNSSVAVAAAAAAAQAAYSRPGGIMSGFSRYSLPGAITTSNSVTLASSIISTSPRLAHSQNGSGPQPTSRYYTARD